MASVGSAEVAVRLKEDSQARIVRASRAKALRFFEPPLPRERGNAEVYGGGHRSVLVKTASSVWPSQYARLSSTRVSHS